MLELNRPICYLHVHEGHRGYRRAAPKPEPLPAPGRARRAADRDRPQPTRRRDRPPADRGQRPRSPDRRGTRLAPAPPWSARTASTRWRSVCPQPRAGRDTRRALTLALFYADASALVKLVRDEPESAALRAFNRGRGTPVVRARAHGGSARDTTRCCRRPASPTRRPSQSRRRGPRRGRSPPARPRSARGGGGARRAWSASPGRDPRHRGGRCLSSGRTRHLRRAPGSRRASCRPAYRQSRRLTNSFVARARADPEAYGDRTHSWEALGDDALAAAELRELVLRHARIVRAQARHRARLCDPSSRTRISSRAGSSSPRSRARSVAQHPTIRASLSTAASRAPRMRRPRRRLGPSCYSEVKGSYGSTTKSQLTEWLDQSEPDWAASPYRRSR